VDGDFSITQNSCKGTLQPNNYCFATILFSPITAGIRTGTLFVTSNDPLHPKAGISLEGVGDTVYAAPTVAYLNSPTVQIKNGPVTVQVTGANFYPASVIKVNGLPQPTTYSSSGLLQATIDSILTGSIGEIQVSVFTPTPGGGTSVAVPLTRYEVVNLDAAFLTSVPGSKFLYVSVPSSSPVNPNTVIPINPANGAFGTPIPVGHDPGLLAASSDGSYLFLVANQDQTVQRINLSTRAVDKTFPFPPNSQCPGCGPQAAADLKGMPGSPKEVVLALAQVMALYNDQGMVNYIPTSSIAFAPTFSSFAYAGSPLTIYSLPFTIVQNSFFNIVTINANGLNYTPLTGGNYGGNNTTGAEVASDGTLLYTSAGEVWSPVTQTKLGTFPVTTFNDTSYPNLHNLSMDLQSSHIFLVGAQFYGADSASIVLSAYSQKSLGLRDALAFPQIPIPLVECLVRWGSNGFAFLDQGSVYLLMSSIATSPTTNPIPHVNSITPSSIPMGSSDAQLTLNGQGFTESSVVMWGGNALPTTYTAKSILTAVVPAADLANSGPASLTVTNPAPGGGNSNALPFTISPLTPLISFSSSAVVFPNQTVGTSSLAQTIAVQNPGTANLAISEISITGADATSFRQTHTCGSTLAPGANCTVSVFFKPTLKGALSASLKFTDSASGSPHVISVQGTGN
jgi:hypothetical protein